MLVDGNSMLFRAYYATVYGQRMSTSAGVPTNAVYGFLMMLQKALDTEKPDAVYVAFDAGKHTFRHDLYAEYKGNRKPAPDDLVPQFGLTRDMLDAYHIAWSEMEDIEADDLIGTMSRKYPDFNTVIFTSDHDYLQLVDETTSVLLMKKGMSEMEIMTPERIEEEMEITPLQVIDLKGLMGDKSDNIPGVAGVGEKTAVKLLKEYGTVENVVAHEDEIKGALGSKIRASHDMALLSKQLATIRRDVPIDVKIEDCLFEPDYVSLIQFLNTLEMKSMASRYKERLTSDHQEQVKKEAAKVEQMPSFSGNVFVYLDEDGRNFMEAEGRGIAVSDDHGTYYEAMEEVQKDSGLLAVLKEGKAIGFDAKRMKHILKRYGIEASFHDDVMVMANLVNSNLTSPDKIYEAYAPDLSIKEEDVYGKKNKPVLMIDEEKQAQYGGQYAEAARKIYEACLPKLKEYDMMHLYTEIEMPLEDILGRMEDAGIRVDEEVLNEIASRTAAQMDEEQKAIYEAAGKEFNINSPKQLAAVLYDDLGLYGGKKRSTSADVLARLKGAHPIIDHILSYRKLTKLYSTYAEGLKKYIRKDGRIHTVFNQAATSTGRLSSSDPNLQNISVRDEAGREIRKAFLPDEGCVLISCDYHQIELRILAHMADEKTLIEAFNEGIDIHTRTAMDVFGVKKEDVTPLMRRQAKTVNFGIVYGISDYGLAEQLGVPVNEARDFIETYYKHYPRIRTYMDGVVKECEEKGYVKTLMNRRREIPEIHDKNRAVREFGKRAAMNAPIQGSAADLIKKAMIDVDRMMKEKGVKSRMILQVHDELIFNVPEDEVELMKQLINDGMVNAMKLNVPLTAECAVGKDWYEAK
jgi:DNA polymerase-1